MPLAEGMLTVLLSVIKHCAQPDAGGRSPSDFPLAHLDQSAVDRLAGDGRSVEDIYPLTPMQAGIVFHVLSQPEQELYVEQFAFVLDGVPDARVLGAAWQHIVDRTPVLRSGMVHNMEPAVYLEGKGGIRLNDNVVVRQDGNEVLSSQLSRDLDWLVVQ